MKEKSGIGGVAVMENRSDFFPRFRPVPPQKPNGVYTRVTYTPGGYYCEKWELRSDDSGTTLAPRKASPGQHRLTEASRGHRTEWFVDIFFLISVGLFVLTFLWAQGLLK